MIALKFTVLFFLLAAFEISITDALNDDYTYIGSTHNYYKLHAEHNTWGDARLTCLSEGALLFHPVNKAELEQVLTGLSVQSNIGGWNIFTGFSDLDELKNYKTVDGYPISIFYNNWKEGEPNSGSDNAFRCGILEPDTLYLRLYSCSYARGYICKKKQTKQDEILTTIEKANTIIANSSDKIVAALKQQMTNQTALLDVYERKLTANQSSILARLTEAIANQAVALNQQTEAMQQQAASQTSALERLATALGGQKDVMQLQATNQALALERVTASLDEQKDAMQLQATNQTSVLERMAANQIFVLERLAATLEGQKVVMQQQATNHAAAVDRQTEAMQRYAANQTAAMERLALAIEKLASLQEDNNQLDNRLTEN